MFDSRRGTHVALILLLLATAFVYWPGLQGPLIFDDAANLEPLRELERQGALSFTNIMRDRGGWFDRPVSMLSFYANWLLTGDDIGSLKLTNLLIHLFCGVLIYGLVQCLLVRVDDIKKTHVQSLALCVAALWLLTPIQISAVLYIIQRMAQLATLFSLAGLLFYCMGRSRISRSPVWGTALILSAIMMCWPLAILSKQNGALLPLLLLITEWFFFSQNKADKFVTRVRVGLLMCVLVPALGVVVYAVARPQWIDKYYFTRDFTLYERLLTQPRVLLDYAANVVQVPGISSLGFFHDDVATSVSLISPLSTLPAIMVLLAVLLLSLHYCRGKGDKSKGAKGAGGVLLYGMLFFICAHLIEASVFPLEMYFEHRNYLPGFGLLLALTIGLHRLGQILAMARVFNILLVTLVVSYAGLSAARAWVWMSWGGIVRAAVVTHPTSIRAQAGMAITYLLAGDINKALPYLQREKSLAGHQRDDAVSLKLMTGYCLADRTVPENVYDNFDTGNVLSDDAATLSALRWFQDVISNHECEQWIHSKWVADILQRKSAQLTGPGTLSHNWELHYYLGRLLIEWNRESLAYPHFKKAYRYAPESRVKEILMRLQTSRP